MNNFKSSIPYVCTGSGHKRIWERHDINTGYGYQNIQNMTLVKSGEDNSSKFQDKFTDVTTFIQLLTGKSLKHTDIDA